MYSIDSMYEAMADAVIEASKDQKANRWVAAAAIWLGRQQIFSARDYWYAVAAKVTSLLPAAEKDAIAAQLSKQEDIIFDSVTDWPAIPDSLQSIISTWSPAPVEVDLEVVKAEAVSKVDRAAEAYRMQFITPGFGQVMTYQQKLVEARAVVADPSVDEAEIPHIVSEAAATGKTVEAVAQEVVVTFETWQQLSASIEGKRMAAKTAIQAAETAEAISAAADVNWAA